MIARESVIIDRVRYGSLTFDTETGVYTFWPSEQNHPRWFGCRLTFKSPEAARQTIRTAIAAFEGLQKAKPGGNRASGGNHRGGNHRDCRR